MKTPSNSKIDEQVKIFIEKEVDSLTMMSQMRKLGFTYEECTEVLEKVQQHSDKVFNATLKKIQDKDEKEYKTYKKRNYYLDVLAIFAGLICLICIIIGVSSVTGLTILLICCSVVGYRLSPEMPFAGITSIMIFCVIGSYFIPQYMEGRTQLFTIEGYIIYGVPGIPAVLWYKLLLFIKKNNKA